MGNSAKEIIIPSEPNIFRAICLYVGQGDSTLLVIPEGDKYKYVLVDSHKSESTGGIEIVALLTDLFKGEKKGLDVYINTHPHSGHLGKVKEIYEKVGIAQVWHSGHKPGGDHKEAYEDFEFVMKKVGEENVYRLRGSKEENKLDGKAVKIGDVNFNILAPADYVSDDIEGEKPEDRYRRIHEQCAVIRFKYGKDEKQILLTGDADLDAWKEHITNYHSERLPSAVLSAAHHGSNSFFWKDSTDDDPYKEHLEKIKPTYITVSAPKQTESKHGHPDKKAMDLYKEQVGEDAVFHLGKSRECIIIDIDADGGIDVYPDNELVKEYGNKDNNGNGGEAKKAVTRAVVSKIDKKPMGK